MADLYFELNLFLEALPQNYGTANANYYFRIHKMKPSREEYRKKVIEYMRHYEYTLSAFAGTPNYSALRSFVAEKLGKIIDDVLNGNNKEVEKRYKYYIMNEL